MTDREKVIRGLECCTQHGSMSGRNCNGHWGYTDASHTRMELIGEYRAGCTYGSCETGCVKTLAKDALALLKAQEPCEDAVSRKDVINVLQSPCDMRYVNGNWHPCIGDYIEAITNLSAVAPKAQEPRVLELSEIHRGVAVWLDDVDKADVILAIGGSSAGGTKCFITENDISIAPLDAEYNVRWRAWTAEPTEEQRKATPWHST